MSDIDPNSLYVKDLREELRLRGLDCKGKRGALVKRLQNALQREQADVVVSHETTHPKAHKSSKASSKSSSSCRTTSVSAASKVSSSSHQLHLKEVARLRELEVKLKYMDQENELEEGLEKLNRQRRKLGLQRELEEASARCSVYCQDDTAASVSQASSQDRVQRYVEEQEPSFGNNDEKDDTPIRSSDRAQVSTDLNYMTVKPKQETISDENINKVVDPSSKRDCDNAIDDKTNVMSQNAVSNTAPKTSTDVPFIVHVDRLPPPEPGIFTGNPMQFPGWLTSFELLIESKKISAAECLHYMRRYLGGEAKECIEGYMLLSTDDAYTEAKNLLKERYGNNFTIANAFRTKLREWPKITTHDGIGLQKLSDFLLQCESAMRSNTYLQALNDCHENQAILRKLPDWLVNRWSRIVEDWNHNNGNFPPFSEFCKFLKKEAKIANNPITAIQQFKSPQAGTRRDELKQKRTLSAMSSANTDLCDGSQRQLDVKRNETRLSLNNDTGRKRKPCPQCSGDHHLNFCQDFLKGSLRDRRDFAKNNKLCFSCLRPNHSSRECRNKMRCTVCGKSHPSSLHDWSWQSKTSQLGTNAVSKNFSTRATVGKVNVSDSSKQSYSTSMIIPVFVSHANQPEREVLVYALLDTQSDASFITESTCSSLGVDGPSTELMLTTITSDKDVVKVKKIKDIIVRGYQNEKRIELPVLYTTVEVPGCVDHIPTRETAKQWAHLRPLQHILPPLLDADFGLLIGYNCSQALTPREVIASQLDPKDPYAQRTDLGWSIVGTGSSPTTQENSSTCHRISVMETEGRAKIVQKVKVKELFKPSSQTVEWDDGTEERKLSYEDCKFIRQLTEGIHEREGHYEMPLPFKDENTKLPNNKSVCVQRLQHLKRRLLKDDKYRNDYEKFMKEMIERGDCEKVPPGYEHKPGSKWYIPHHGVYHPKKPGKIRIVFDCSA